MHSARAFWALSLLVCVIGVGRTQPVELVQRVSREHPAFNVAKARLAVGKDGRVYLMTGGNPSYVLRVNRDGTGKTGGTVVYAGSTVTANAQGTVATANAHFNHAVNLYGPRFEHLAAVSDFLVNDQVGWDAPNGVEAGASGDFYGLDPHRNRIVRVSPAGKQLASYRVRPDGEPDWGPLEAIRVCEKTATFFVLSRGTIRCVSFDGKVRWSLKAEVGGNPWDGFSGGFDVDDAGALHVVGAAGDKVRKFSADGKPAGEVKLPAADRSYRVSDLRVFGNDFVVKRNHPEELFRTYDAATGKLRHTVLADVERLTVSFPGEVWTAGQKQLLSIKLDTPGRTVRPRWRVWLRPFNTPDYAELPLANGAITVPADAAGIYQVKMSPDLRGADSEYMVQTIVEIRQPGTKGSATVLTPGNRLYYGRGEAIPVSVVLRAKPGDRPAEVTLRLLEGKRELARQKLPVTADQPAALTLSGKLTALLRPGNYTLVVDAPGLNGVGQPLVIGPGFSSQTPFFRVQFGDYGPLYPSGDFWNTPDGVAAHLRRSQKLGTNLFVDRIGSHLHVGETRDSGLTTFGELEQRLKVDPLGVAPEKARVQNALLQTVSGYGAAGIHQMAVLLYMDAGLPLGTPHDTRKPEQMVADLTQATRTLAPYQAFRGWSWNANWWVGKLGAEAATSPQQKAAYLAALKNAQETGKWDPVLDQVSDIVLGHAVKAEELFRNRLKQSAPGQVSAIAGPWRNVTVYPPKTFAHVDEVDLHYQAEQIQPPNTFPHNVNFQKRPGKRAWGHPELWNDGGPAAFDQILLGRTPGDLPPVPPR